MKIFKSDPRVLKIFRFCFGGRLCNVGVLYKQSTYLIIFYLCNMKDACYKKVKKRYRVFPSAYASGAIAKCRKVGAKNWGNGRKKK